MTCRISNRHNSTCSHRSSLELVSCVLCMVMQVKSHCLCLILAICMIMIFVYLLQTPLQRKRTLMVFYLTLIPFCVFGKYAERKYSQDTMDKHLNKSKLFGGRKLYPDTWTGKLWWNVVLKSIWLKIKICELT